MRVNWFIQSYTVFPIRQIVIEPFHHDIKSWILMETDKFSDRWGTFSVSFDLYYLNMLKLKSYSIIVPEVFQFSLPRVLLRTSESLLDLQRSNPSSIQKSYGKISDPRQTEGLFNMSTETERKHRITDYLIL